LYKYESLYLKEKKEYKKDTKQPDNYFQGETRLAENDGI
jgi:hypothetical protein